MIIIATFKLSNTPNPMNANFEIIQHANNITEEIYGYTDGSVKVLNIVRN